MEKKEVDVQTEGIKPSKDLSPEGEEERAAMESTKRGGKPGKLRQARQRHLDFNQEQWGAIRARELM